MAFVQPLMALIQPQQTPQASVLVGGEGATGRFDSLIGLMAGQQQTPLQRPTATAPGMAFVPSADMAPAPPLEMATAIGASLTVDSPLPTPSSPERAVDVRFDDIALDDIALAGNGLGATDLRPREAGDPLLPAAAAAPLPRLQPVIAADGVDRDVETDAPALAGMPLAQVTPQQVSDQRIATPAIAPAPEIPVAASPAEGDPVANRPGSIDPTVMAAGQGKGSKDSSPQQALPDLPEQAADKAAILRTAATGAERSAIDRPVAAANNNATPAAILQSATAPRADAASGDQRARAKERPSPDGLLTPAQGSSGTGRQGPLVAVSQPGASPSQTEQAMRQAFGQAVAASTADSPPAAVDARLAPAAADAPAAPALTASAAATPHAPSVQNNAAAPAATPAQPLPADPPAAQQVGLGIARAASDGATRMTVKLSPRELGRVEVRMEFSADGHVKAHVLASSADALDLLQRDVRSLERALLDSGLKTDSGSLSFSLNQNNNQPGMGQNFAGGHGEGGEAPLADAAIAADLNAEQDALETLSFEAKDGVDIVV